MAYNILRSLLQQNSHVLQAAVTALLCVATLAVQSYRWWRQQLIVWLPLVTIRISCGFLLICQANRA